MVGATWPSMTRARRHRRESQSPCRTVFPPFIAVSDAVFDRLFGEDESKAVGESSTWPFRCFFTV
jgi:hypothetical protein